MAQRCSNPAVGRRVGSNNPGWGRPVFGVSLAESDPIGSFDLIWFLPVLLVTATSFSFDMLTDTDLPPFPNPKQPALPHSFTPSNFVEFISSRSTTTSTLFIYDLAEQAGFGSLSKAWSKSDQGATSVVPLQT